MISGYHQQIADHYEKYPYPPYPLYAFGNWQDLKSLNLEIWGAKRKIENLWIAGCGTIAPLMFGRRNPDVKILATDLSERSLRKAKWRLRLFGIWNVQFRCEDLFESKYIEAFDAIDCYGVIHHTVSPEKSLTKLMEALRPGGAIRFMVYSDNARAEIESLRREAHEKKLDSVPAIRSMILEQKKELTGDLTSTAGIADAFLNPIVHVFSRSQLDEFLKKFPQLEVLQIFDRSNFVVYGRKRS
jgi:SAM-dependent methyltransferase